MKDVSYDMLGIVTVGNGIENNANNGVQILGKIENLTNLVRLYRIKQIIFSTEKLSYEQILKSMSKIEYSFIEYKIVPSNLEVMIGKSNIERLDDYPLLEIEYSIGNPFNKFVKRFFDLFLSTMFLLITCPIALMILVIKRKRLKKFAITGDKNEKVVIRQLEKINFKRWINRWLLFLEVVKGKISIVGSPIIEYMGQNYMKSEFSYKPGLTGIVQINRKKIRLPEDVEKYHLFYLKNQSLLLDIEILLKAFFQKLLFAEE